MNFKEFKDFLMNFRNLTPEEAFYLGIGNQEVIKYIISNLAEAYLEQQKTIKKYLDVNKYMLDTISDLVREIKKDETKLREEFERKE